MSGPGEFTIIVKGQGEIIYEEVEYNRVIGCRKAEINPLQVFELFCFAEERGFFEMRSSYTAGRTLYLNQDDQIDKSEDMMTDLPSTTIMIKAGKQSKSVWNYYGAPKRLIQIENKIKKLARVIQSGCAGWGSDQ